MQERRKLARSRVIKSAKLVVGTSSVVDCVVHNLTNTGARIEVPNPASLPDNLVLTFDGGRSMRSCRLVWRTVNETGVEFLAVKRA
ncbi:MAG TPA: PilZ domain-containing protein [Acidobacteriota bacterium]|nr:PilZ domain-containing protein [Acidobacteriota bacterium]